MKKLLALLVVLCTLFSLVSCNIIENKIADMRLPFDVFGDDDTPTPPNNPSDQGGNGDNGGTGNIGDTGDNGDNGDNGDGDTQNPSREVLL